MLKQEYVEGKESILQNFSGTHASVDILVSLAFNKYMLNTPVYGDMLRLMDLNSLYRVKRSITG